MSCPPSSSSPSRRRAPPGPGPERRLPILLRQAWFSLNQTFRRRLVSIGLTPDQYTALRTLEEHEPKGLIQGELARLMASDPNTIAALVERMMALGWMARVRHEKDRRAYRLRVLPAGRKQFELGRRVALALQSELLAAWPVRKREKFLKDLAWVADRCRSAANASVTANFPLDD